MRNLPTILSSLALIGVLILFGLHFSDKNNNNSKPSAGSPSGATANPSGLRVAYVQIDTFEANYTYLRQKRKEFTDKQDAMRAELERSNQQFQAAAAAFQNKAQAGKLTQAEGEAEQKRLSQMNQSLQTRSQSMEEQLVKEQQDFNDKLRKSLDDFLLEYNKDKKYDYVLSYSISSPFLYVNPNLDITADVLKGMNARGNKDAESSGKK